MLLYIFRWKGAMGSNVDVVLEGEAARESHQWWSLPDDIFT